MVCDTSTMNRIKSELSGRLISLVHVSGGMKVDRSLTATLDECSTDDGLRLVILTTPSNDADYTDTVSALTDLAIRYGWQLEDVPDYSTDAREVFLGVDVPCLNAQESIDMLAALDHVLWVTKRPEHRIVNHYAQGEAPSISAACIRFSTDRCETLQVSHSRPVSRTPPCTMQAFRGKMRLSGSRIPGSIFIIVSFTTRVATQSIKLTPAVARYAILVSVHCRSTVRPLCKPA